MNKIFLQVCVVMIGISCVSTAVVSGQVGQVRTDTGAYGLTPEEYRPFSRFEDPYKEFFLTVLEYPGYGRHLPEPESVETVQRGLEGAAPFVRSRLARRLSLKRMPQLRFRHDPSLEQGSETLRVLREIADEQET